MKQHVSVFDKAESDVGVLARAGIRLIGAEFHLAQALRLKLAVRPEQESVLHPQAVCAESVAVAVLLENRLVYGNVPAVQVRRSSLDSVMHSVEISLRRRVCHLKAADVGLLVAMAQIVGVIILQIDPVRLTAEVLHGDAGPVLEIIIDLGGAQPEEIRSLVFACLLQISLSLLIRGHSQFQPGTRKKDLVSVQVLRLLINREKKAVVSDLVKKLL